MPNTPNRAIARTPRASASATSPTTTPFAVLIDGSALFLTVRAAHEGRQLDYRRLVDVLSRGAEGLTPSWSSGSNLWVMWTSVAAQNQGQARFLDFAEKDLCWETRRFSPAESYMVDPSAIIGYGSDGRSATRLLRFDAHIAFAMGRLADTHRLLVVTDSYALSDAFLRCASIPSAPRHTLAFFGRALDPRWQRILRSEPKAPSFIDLDEHEGALFGDAEPGPYRSPQPQGPIVF